eukprot:TRINITY_DN3912_c0_g1_i1.p1 TRINITY_DN3912_c0_g1~~TRINITY_DN3912_c0_g1_i1.p1  ORF type:complete len:564 (-),score=138.35 TRINITY_DN3912_c0_g1_i1:121-1812(-)
MEFVLTIKRATNVAFSSFFGANVNVVASLGGKTVFQTPFVVSSPTASWEASSEPIVIWSAKQNLVLEVFESRWVPPATLSKGRVSIPIEELVSAKTIESKDYPLSLHGSITIGFKLTKSLPKKSKIAIVGSGISGASASYFLKQLYSDLGSELEIVVYEKDDNVGGRVGTFELDGHKLEKGGAILLDTGFTHFKKFVDKFNLEIEPPFDPTATLGIWNGETFVLNQGSSLVTFLFNMVKNYNTSLLRLFRLNSVCIEKYNSIYRYLEDHHAFESGYDLLDAVGLGYMTEITMRETCNILQINEKMYNELLTGICRSNNGLSPDDLTSYVGTLCMTLNPTKIYSVKGGNVQVIEKLFEASGAQVRTNSGVTEIVRNENGNVTVRTANGSEEFDAVMLATQLHYANKIKWEGIALPAGFTAEREYHTMHEAWAIAEPNENYFKSQDVPGTVLTTNNPDIPFASIMTLKKLPNGKLLLNAKSRTPITEETINIIWKNIDSFYLHSWSPAFPATVPVKKEDWPPFKVADRVYFANVLETTFSNIESSIMSAQNAATILIKGMQRVEN